MKRERHWILAIAWNPVMFMNPLKEFNPLGVAVTWGEETWMVHVFLLVILIEFGVAHVD